MDGLDGRLGISVTGRGRVAVEPDFATLRVGVSLADKSLEQARSDAAVKITAARDHLVAGGVAGSDIRTSRLDVHNAYDRDRHRQTFYLSTSLEATIRDLTAAETIVNGLFAAIGDGMETHGLSFGVEDPRVGRDRALALAFEDAQAKATHLAGLAGVALGPVLAISEGASPGHRPPARMAAMAASIETADIPIEAGELDQQASISVRWAIEDR